MSMSTCYMIPQCPSMENEITTQLTQTQGIERSWPDKIVYELRIPGRAYVLGDPIQLDFQYIALRKGVYPTSIQLRLVERHTLKSTGGLGHSQHTQTRTHTRSRIRGEDTSSYEESSGTSVISEDMEEWRVSSPVLPSSQTKSCVPSCQTSIIDVEHSLDVTIMLHNPDGHFSMVSYVCCSGVLVTWSCFADCQS